MKTIDWIGAGIGSLFSGGFLNYLGSIPLGAGSMSFGYLTLVLESLGIVFVGYGIVKDFVISKIEKAQEKEEVSEKQ